MQTNVKAKPFQSKEAKEDKTKYREVPYVFMTNVFLITRIPKFHGRKDVVSLCVVCICLQPEAQYRE